MSVALSSSPSPRRGQERLQRRLRPRRHGPRAQLLVALGVEQVLVERAGLEDLPLLGGGRLQQPRVDLGQRVGDLLAAGPGALQQRAELEQLHVADDGVRDVEVGVEAHLPEPPADLGDRGEQLVAQDPERGLQRLGGPEQLLLARLPCAADRLARLLGERRRVLRGAAVGLLRVGEHEPLARARHRDVQQPPHPVGVRRLGVGRERLLEQRVRDRLQRPLARAGHPRRPSARARTRGRTAAPWRRASSSPAPRAGGRRPRPPPRAAPRRRPRRSSGRTRAPSPAGSGARSRRPARRTWPGCAAARRPRWRRRTAAGGGARASPRAGARRGRVAPSRSPAAAMRCRLRKWVMRSRASGGICGDSSAAPIAATMSSLRRRAIWVTRARSIARSSTGGRASARTTAPASPGSTSSRSHASRSRTSARWKNAAAPASR